MLQCEYNETDVFLVTRTELKSGSLRMIRYKSEVGGDDTIYIFLKHQNSQAVEIKRSQDSSFILMNHYLHQEIEVIVRQVANNTTDPKTRSALELCVKIFEENLNFQISGNFMPNPGEFNLEDEVIKPVFQMFGLPKQILEFRKEPGMPSLRLLVDRVKI
jgi:hypothetical protein